MVCWCEDRENTEAEPRDERTKEATKQPMKNMKCVIKCQKKTRRGHRSGSDFRLHMTGLRIIGLGRVRGHHLSSVFFAAFAHRPTSRASAFCFWFYSQSDRRNSLVCFSFAVGTAKRFCMAVNSSQRSASGLLRSRAAHITLPCCIIFCNSSCSCAGFCLIALPVLATRTACQVLCQKF